MSFGRLLLLLIPATVWAVDVPPFSDETLSAGLNFTHQNTPAPTFEGEMMPPGMAAGDFNRDGFLDLVVQGGEGQNAALFINNKDGTFSDQTLAWGIDIIAEAGSSLAVADINGDGYPDLHAGVINPGTAEITGNRLYLNTGLNTFQEISASAGVDSIYGTYGASFGDIDLDGDLDLATGDWGAHPGISFSTLLQNNGDNTFTNITAAAGVFNASGKLWAFTPALVDMNGDHYPDLPLAADFGTSQYHSNDGDGTFTQLFNNGTTTDENGMGAAFADYDNDGDLDWFITAIFDDDGTVEGNWGTTGNRLYRNDGNHQFTDVTDLAGVRNGFWGWGASFGDYNHDGLLDLVMTNGFMLPSGPNPDATFNTDPDRLWLNTGDFSVGPTYTEASLVAGLVHSGDGKGLISFDSDNDGDLDIVVSTNQGDLKFFRNHFDPDPGRWLEIDLLAPTGNAPDGVGATVQLTANGITYHRTVFGSPSYMSQEPLRLHFGFPAADALLVTRMALGLIAGTPRQKLRADMNQDGQVGGVDVLLIHRRLLL